MVFFICNYCGESIKKPTVEKHYITKCRNRVKNISCMDCQKDFYAEDYAAHTRCISEAEKYSGKTFVPKPSQNKGLKKQETWTEIVRSILENVDYKLPAKTRQIFQRLQNYENVPRKKQKFQNFVANCLKMPINQAAPVWNVLEKELDKMKQAKQQQYQQQNVQKTEFQEDAVMNNNEIKQEENAVKATSVNHSPDKCSQHLGLHKMVEFKFRLALENLINKYKDGININKLKDKFMKKYQKKCLIDEMDDEENKKYEKKFNKTIKKLSKKLEIVGDIIKPRMII